MKFFGQALCFLLVVFFAQTLHAQSLHERSDQIHSSVESGNLNAALDGLKSLQTADASAFALNNYDYLLARLLERTGDHAGSSSNYQSVVARHSLLSQYALWHLAQMARSTGDLVLERERLRQLIITAPTSLLRDAATIRLAESFLESADYSAVVSTLRPLTESKNATMARRALTLSSEAYVRAGKPTEARDLFTKLVTNMPDSSRPDDFALAAVRGLDALEKGEMAKAVSEADHLRRAGIYQFNRDFENARLHYLAVVENYGQSADVPDALYQLGRGCYQQDKYDDALKYLLRLVDRYGTSDSARDGLALIAATYSRQKRREEAVAAYKQSIERFPAAPSPERPYLNIIDVLRDTGRDDEALSWVKQTRARFKDQIGGTLALFAQAKIHLAQNSWNASVNDLDELRQAKDLGGARISGGTTAAEVTFLRAFALEQMGHTQEAIDTYLSIPEGRNEYYGFRANERLHALNADSKSRPFITAKVVALNTEAKHQLAGGEVEAARRSAQTSLRLATESATRSELLDIARRAYASSPAYRFPSFNLLSLGRRDIIVNSPARETMPSPQALADELLFLGLYDEAAPELAAARLGSSAAKSDPGESAGSQNKTGPDQASSASDRDYTLAVYFLRGDLPYPAVRFAEQTWRPIPSDYLLELAPGQMAELLYPAPYRNSLFRYSGPRKIDPRFVLSIARQETRFQADAKSVAAARGLMQFISATAAETAGQLGRSDFRQDDLYNADTAIEFGAQYLSSLFQRFPNQPQAVAAAYNGGADNVARWIARSHSQDPDRYVAEIGFAQSKDYVYRVLSNFWVYQKLYNETLQTTINGNQ